MEEIIFRIMDQCDTMVGLIKQMWVSDLYFMVHWFCLMSWKLFDGWRSKIDLKKYMQVVILDIMDQCYTKIDHIKYICQWPIFHGPVILPYILKTIWWMKIILWIMDWCDSKIDLKKYMQVNDPCLVVLWFCLISWLSTINYFDKLNNGAGRGYWCPSRHLL